jgi:DNA-binding PadR family transcriptional regulator
MFEFTARHGARPRRGHHRGAEWGPWSHAHMREVFEAFRAGRPSVRRGDIRPLILGALRREPMHGYQVIQELEALSGGRWRPSAGSVYPTLQQLEDEGLVRSAEVDGRRVYSLTDEGREAAAEAPGPGPDWFGAEQDGDSVDVRRLALQLAGASMQVRKMGSPKAQQQARDVLVDARRRLYRILADDVDDQTDADDQADLADDQADADAESPGGARA